MQHALPGDAKGPRCYVVAVHKCSCKEARGREKMEKGAPLWCRGGGEQGGAHLHSGSAIEREGLDLPVLQENLQHVGDEEESFLLQHVLQGKREGRRQGEGLCDGAVTASLASRWLCARRHISLEIPASPWSIQRRRA